MHPPKKDTERERELPLKADGKLGFHVSLPLRRSLRRPQPAKKKWRPLLRMQPIQAMILAVVVDLHDCQELPERTGPSDFDGAKLMPKPKTPKLLLDWQNPTKLLACR